MENIINELTIDDTSEISKEEKVDDVKTPVDSQTDEDELANVENYRSVSAIMQDLQKDLERPVMEVVTKSFVQFFVEYILYN